MRILTILPLLAAFSVQAQNVPSISNLIAHFPMDGDPNDTVQGLVPSTILGAPTFCEDRFGNPNSAACFDGASLWSYGDVLDVDTSDFAISLWLRTDTVEMDYEVFPGAWNNGSNAISKATIFGFPPSAGYSIMVQQPAADDFVLRGITGDAVNTQLFSNTSWTLDEWHHIILTRCGHQEMLFIDSLLVSDSTTSMVRDLSTNIVFSIGGLNRDPSPEYDSQFLFGAVDDVRVYKGTCDQSTMVEDAAQRSKQPSLWPNPVQSTLRIEVPAESTINGPLTVLNAFGQVVSLSASKMVLDQDRIRSITMDVSAMSAGAYFVVVPTENGSMYGRFIKE